jgi:phospholipid/cholesterol/gamma-HCH transport system permease protein
MAVESLSPVPERASPPPAVTVPRSAGPVSRAVQEYGALLRFGGRSIKSLPGTLWYFSEVLRQFAVIAVETVWLLAFLEVMIAVSGSNFAYFLLKAVGATDFTGIGGPLTGRVACLAMFGYVFVAKVCGGFVAEIGAMKIGEEISALESVGVDPMRYVVGTRVLATIMFVPVAVGVAALSFYVGYYVNVVIVLHGVSGVGVNEFYWGVQSLRDLEYMFVVIAATAIVTAIVACFYGMRTVGGPAAIGDAVAGAVIRNLVIVHVLGSVIVTLWYATNYGLTIGG